MQYFLLTLALLPLLVQSGSEYPNCTKNSKKPKWKLHDIHYNGPLAWTDAVITPPKQTVPGHVSFTLSSNVVDFTADCSASTSSPFNGSVWYPCKMPASAIPSDKAWFKFDKKYRVMELNQTYTCWESLGPTLVTYFAYGRGRAYINNCYPYDIHGPTPNDSIPGEDCLPVDANITASEISAIA
ncbi:hypothetical protein BCR34DRAFT_274795 [Clohesyomyces aquaticus]|uniref:AA1-like domain-containing protein n=1 Tax=Clohesyomyces aquaticus TaxID=1231657 RepID=A0A1Y1ZSF0_9PLEO|nr:hypothetical protein BCR34DRAFT_274795 [Clohesyomyces aquaticus]